MSELKKGNIFSMMVYYGETPQTLRDKVKWQSADSVEQNAVVPQAGEGVIPTDSE